MHQHRIQEEHGGNNEDHIGVYNGTLSKIKLSKFYGDNPQDWIKKCRKFLNYILL